MEDLPYQNPGTGNFQDHRNGAMDNDIALKTAIEAIEEGGQLNAPTLGNATISGGIYTPLSGLIGGGPTNLDGIVTVGVSVGLIALVSIPGQGLFFWQLVSGTSTEDGTNIIRPDDYAVSTNEKIWIPAA